jgi:surfeit locus 1 family protein
MRAQVGIKSSLVKIWLFVAIFFPLTLYLGFWQLDRAEQKEGLSNEMSQLASSAAQPLVFSTGNPSETVVEGSDEEGVETGDVKRYQPLYVTGKYLSSHFLLDNQLRQGRVGYEVLNAFEVRQGWVILVNRGWVPAPAYRDQLPSISAPEEELVLTGYFYWPDKEMVQLSSQHEQQGEFASRLQVVDWPYIKQMLNETLVVSSQFRLIDSQQPGAYQIDWKAHQMGPEKHFGYAFQWFSLAFALIVLALVATAKIVRSESQEEGKP